jgi:hypothetical protein
MPRPNLRASRPSRRRRSHRFSLTTFSRFIRRRWSMTHRVTRAVLKSPPTVRVVIMLSGLLLLWLGINWAYHAYEKPAEILFPLDHAFDKSPAQTWKEYGSLFREHSTHVITPELLAALAQIEGAGNPAARTYWRWKFSWNPLEWYQPASSAVGMFQITDGTFEQAKRYCIHEHKAVEDGPWHDMHSCWFNNLYSRVLPSHAIEMTAALLDRNVASAMKVRRSPSATLKRKQDLAAVIHLCGAGAGQNFARRGFRPSSRQRCGDHDVKSYLAKVNSMKRHFSLLTASEKTTRPTR